LVKNTPEFPNLSENHHILSPHSIVVEEMKSKLICELHFQLWIGIMHKNENLIFVHCAYPRILLESITAPAKHVPIAEYLCSVLCSGTFC
jgi:hypothetical protein